MASRQWDLHKSEIERLYIHECKTLAEVMSYMAIQYSWHKRPCMDFETSGQKEAKRKGERGLR
ncbi:hypothetical protein N7451_004431 [Penicillium sp. IBT 35674x]|nr:hypothetical protein N7451_004431 [Penicillium sp. IBT 35674x]